MNYIVLYNSRFKINHPELFNKCEELAKEGKIDFHKYKEYLRTPEQLKEIVSEVADVFDLVPRGKRNEIGKMKLSEAINRMLKNPKNYMVSVIMVDKTKPDFTWIECGQVCLKSFLKSKGWL